METLCYDTELVNYLIDSNIVMHSCSNIMDTIDKKKNCGVAIGDILDNPTEDAEIASSGHALGAANLLDIVHHVYGGDSGRVFANEKWVYRVLFAGSFHPKDVYLFMRQLELLQASEKYAFTNYSSPHPSDGHRVMVYVLADEAAVVEQVDAHFSKCATKKLPRNIRFVTSTLLLSQANDLRFDYIDFQNDISTNEHYSDALTLYRDLLSPSGVIGITAYSENNVVNKIRQLLIHGDVEAHLPFSADVVKFVYAFLVAEGYKEIADKDIDLLHFIAAMPSHMGGSTWQKSWSVSGLSIMLSNIGMEDVSFIPAFVKNPYGWN